MRAYSIEFRREVLADCDRGMGTWAVAIPHKVSDSWVRRLKPRRQLGELAPRPPIKKTPPTWHAYADQLRQMVEAQPDITLTELRTQLGIKVSLQTLSNALRGLQFTFKKVIHASEQDRSDVAVRRAAWIAQQVNLDPAKLVFLDETWAKTNMTRPRGRALRGQRLIAKIPHGHWKTTTFLAALRVTGLTAPLVIDGAINGKLFLAYIRQQLAPTLQPGDIVIMDNLSAHQVAGMREAITQCQATLVYLPPYSPELNPIENLFSKFKWLLKSCGERTVAGLWDVCGQLISRFSPQACRNYFRHCGYSATEVVEAF